MKSHFIIPAILLSACANLYAQEEIIQEEVVVVVEPADFSAYAVQGAMATGGFLSMGLAHYTPFTEIGLTVSASLNNADEDTKLFNPVLFFGLRKAIFENTYFAYGIDLVGTFGRELGQEIDADYAVGPYISLEQQLTSRLLLSGWIQPYSYQYSKINGSGTSTHGIFAGGGIGLNYFFHIR